MLDRGLDVAGQEGPQALRRGCGGVRGGPAPRQEALGPLVDDVEQQILLGNDVRIEGASLEAEGLAEIPHRGPVIAALGEQPGGRGHELGPTSANRLHGPPFGPLVAPGTEKRPLVHIKGRLSAPNERSFGH